MPIDRKISIILSMLNRSVSPEDRQIYVNNLISKGHGKTLYTLVTDRKYEEFEFIFELKGPLEVLLEFDPLDDSETQITLINNAIGWFPEVHTINSETKSIHIIGPGMRFLNKAINIPDHISVTYEGPYWIL